MQSNNFGYIYKIINLINNRIYIGKKKGEFNPNYYGSGVILKRALNKYDKKSFKLEVIVYAKDKDKLNELEKSYIAEYRKIFGKDNLYNITDGGDGFKGKHTIETKKKMGLSRIGHLVSEETRKKIGKANSISLRGKPLKHNKNCRCFVCRAKRGETKEQNKGEKNGMFGKHFKHTEETKEKQRLCKLGDLNPCKRPEVREKLRLYMLGRKRGKYQRRKDINEVCNNISIATKEAMWRSDVRHNYLEGLKIKHDNMLLRKSL